MASNVKFYRIDRLPDFASDGKHVGLFVYVPEHVMTEDDPSWVKGYETINGDGSLTGAINVSYLTPPTNPEDDPNFQQAKIDGGLWFGGRQGWELLTNVADGLGWSDIYSWFDSNVAGEAEIFVEASLTGAGETGTKYTIFDPVLDRSTGLHASTENSDAHEFTVGDGALKLTGNQQALSNNNFVVEPAFDIHSANDTADNTLTLDDSLYVTKGSESGAPYRATIGVRVGSNPVTPTNPIITLADIADLNSAMHLVGTLDKYQDTSVGAAHIWPDQTGSHWITSGTPGTDANGNTQVVLKAGDTFIVTTAHDGPDDQTGTGNAHYEVGDTVLFYNGSNGLTYKVVNQNITTGKADGQHAAVDMPNGSLVEGKLVIATNKGIATTSNGISDFVTDIATTQEIVNEEIDEGEEGSGVTYTVTTTITRPDGAADSDANPDTQSVSHNIIFHSNNNSLTIQEGTNDSEPEHQINFDLVWLTTMD